MKKTNEMDQERINQSVDSIMVVLKESDCDLLVIVEILKKANEKMLLWQKADNIPKYTEEVPK